MNSMKQIFCGLVAVLFAVQCAFATVENGPAGGGYSTAVGPNFLPTYLASAGNHVNLPQDINGNSIGTAFVVNSWTKHMSGPADFTNIQPVFVNGRFGIDTEIVANYDYYLRAGLYLNGKFYQFKFSGNVESPLVSKNFGIVKADPLVDTSGNVVTIPANSSYWITEYTRAADNGVAGSYTFYGNTTTGIITQDGYMAGTNPATDYTMGVGVGYGATLGTPVINSAGQMTSIPVATGGQGYNAGFTLTLWNGIAGAGSGGATMPGTGAGGYGNPSSGALGSVTLTGNGSLYSAANPPQAYVGQGGGFGSIQSAQGPFIILGQPNAPLRTMLILGDSYEAPGSQYPDASGGPIEEALYTKYGVFKMCIVGSSGGGWIRNLGGGLYGNTHQLAILKQVQAWGLYMSDAIDAMGVNDAKNYPYSTGFLSGNTTATNTIVSTFHSLGARAYVITIPPSTTSTDSWATLTNQSAYTFSSGAVYGAGGDVELYNTSLYNGTGPSNDGVLDIGALLRDLTTGYKFRVDLYAGGATSGDGTHPNGQGNQWLIDNLNLSPLDLPTSTAVLPKIPAGTTTTPNPGTDLIAVSNGGKAVTYRKPWAAKRNVTGTTDTASVADSIINWTGTTATKTETLPALSAYYDGFPLTVVDGSRTAAAGTPINITAPSGATVNGSATLAITAAGGSYTLEYDAPNTNWIIQ